MNFIRDIIEYGKRVYEREYVSALDGNISVRTLNNTFLITASAKCKGELTPSDIIEIDSEGKIIRGNGKISTEAKLHLFIYKRRKDVRAVMHCHPVYATAFASSGESLDEPVFPEVSLILGRIPLCEYGTPSTEELPESLKPYVDYANVFLLQNHGAVAAGKSLKEAYYRMEKLEHTAKTVYTAKMLGKVNKIPREKLDQLYSLAEENYGIKIHPQNKF